MTGNPDLFEELRAQLERIRARQAANDELLDSVHATRTELSALTASATSPDGTVTVVAGSGGIVQSVRLTQQALRTNADALSELITTAVRDAITHATRRQLEIVRTHLGRDVDPEQILGPQAAFARYAEHPTSTPPPMPEDDDEPTTNVLTRR